MAGLTRVTARAMFRDLLGVRDTSSTWSDDAVDRILNMSQRHVWRQLSSYNADLCMAEENLSYTADADEVDLTLLAVPVTYDIETVHSILWAEDAGGITKDNRATLMVPANKTDLEQWWTDPAGSYDLATWKWSIRAKKYLSIRPIPSQVLYMIFRYIPTPLDMTNSVDVFGGQLPQFHDLVVFRALRIAAAKDKQVGGYFRQVEAEAWEAALPMTDSQKAFPPMARNDVFAK